MQPPPGDAPTGDRTLTAARDPDDASTIPPLTWASRFLDVASLQPWPAGFRLLDDFEILEELGRGGMGVVYRVRPLSGGEPLAVKRTHLLHPDSRRLFLAELQTWLDLPDHPNLAPCRFFRSLGHEVVIFTDLAEGGSLLDAIRAGRLARLADLLDVAIQTARGLHVLHQRGLVHRDVKPANVLLSPSPPNPLSHPGERGSKTDSPLPLVGEGAGVEGVIARVTDFGLARARARIISAETGHSVLVTSGGMTPAYCSPEQARGETVSRRTDVWSWGVLVLETFLGRSPCCETGGPAAPDVLGRYLESPPGPIAAMPADVAELLRLCFVADPAGRWASLGEAAETLEGVYRAEVGEDYPRPAPPAEEAPSAGRPGSSSGGYESPRKWLALAYREAGRDPTEADDRLPPPALTRRAQIVADLSVFDEAAELLRREIEPGLERRQLQAALEVQRSLAHAAAGDYGAAIEGLNRAATTWHELIYGYNHREYLPGLIRAWLHSCHVQRHRGDFDEAIESCDRVIRLWERLDNRRARRDLRDDLATACLEKGLALRGRGDAAASLPFYDRAIEIWRTMVEEEGQDGSADDLAQALLSAAGVLAERGRTDEALAMCDEAIEIRRRLARRRAELAGDLARAYVRKGNVLRTRDEVALALPLYHQAILLLERRLDEMDRDDLAPDLARAYLALGNAERRRGEPDRAAESCARAVGVYERLVQREGRRELTGELARAYVHRGIAVRMAGDADAALTWCDQGIELLRRLVEEGRPDWAGDLARAYVSKANALREFDRHGEALELYDRVIALRRSMPGDRDDVAADLARDRVGRAEVLMEAGEREPAREELTRAEAELESAYERTPRGDLGGVLNKARRLLRELASGGES